MKNIVKILTGLCAIAAVASCNQNVPYVSESYIVAGISSVSVAEDAGTVQIPVCAYEYDGHVAFRNPASSASVAFEVVPVNCTAGTDFAVSPANGILTFQNGSTEYITIDVVDFPGEYYGTKNFVIRLTDPSEGYSIGGLSEVAVSIIDNDHPHLAMFGTYTGYSYENWDGDVTWTLEMYADPDNISTVWLCGLTPTTEGYSAADVYGTVSSDESTITVPLGQSFANGSYDATLISYNGDVVSTGALVLQKTTDGAYVIDDYYGIGAFAGGEFAGWLTLLYGAEFVKD